MRGQRQSVAVGVDTEKLAMHMVKIATHSSKNDGIGSDLTRL